MSKLDNSKILITGGSGFIGSHIVGELLKTNVKKVIVYDNFARGEKKYLEPYISDDRLEISTSLLLELTIHL